MNKTLAILMIAFSFGLIGACASDHDHHDNDGEGHHASESGESRGHHGDGDHDGEHSPMGMFVFDDETKAAAYIHDPLIARMRALEAQVEELGTKKVWSKNFGISGPVQRAWLDGSHLFLEIRNAKTGDYEIEDVDVRSGRSRWIVLSGNEPLDRAPHDGAGAVALLTKSANTALVVNDITGSRFFNVRTQLGPIASSDARAMGPTLYMGDRLSGHFVAAGADTGSTSWSYDVDGHVVGTPVITEGLPRQLVCFGTDGGVIYGLAAKAFDGVAPTSPAWRHDLGGSFNDDPSFGMIGEKGKEKGLLVFPNTNGWLYGCDPATGRRNWVLRTNSAFRGEAAILNGHVFAKNGERLFCLDGKSGDRKWWAESAAGLSDYEREELFRAPEGFELADRALCANDERVFLMQGSSRIVRCEAATGKIVGRYDLSAFDFFFTNERTGALVVGTKDGIFMAFE